MKEQPKRNAAVRWVALGFLLLGAALLAAIYAADKAREPKARHISDYVPWSKETLAIAESIPVQEGGRIKPLSTLAGFTMFQIHGDRSLKIEIDTTEPKIPWYRRMFSGKRAAGAESVKQVIKLTPTEWYLDCLFRPGLAIEQPVFRIDNSAVVTSMGLHGGAKRDRYSYRDLMPGRDKLMELAQTYEPVVSAKRTPDQQQTIDLASNVRKLENILKYFTFTRGIAIDGPNGPTTVSMSNVMSPEMVKVIRDAISRTQGHGDDLPPNLKILLQQVLDAANSARGPLVIFPPDAADDRAWNGMGHEIMTVMTQEAGKPERAQERVRTMENLVRTAYMIGKDGKKDEDFRAELGKFRDQAVSLAKARGEYHGVVAEAGYYRADWFLNALVLFLLSSLLAGGMWVAGWNRTGRVLGWIGGLSTTLGLIFCIIAICQRCYIMQRPPVGNLYDTIVFIATTIVLLALVVELLTRKRFALGLAPVIGAALITLARRYEVGDAKDHMDSLVAVLRSNYWLTVHVITITLGYTGGLLTAFLSHIYLFMRGTGLDEGDRSLRRTLTRATYGCVCLTLFLSLVGTVLGGIWANDSWGRFWGWDPKENGALLIVLWNLAILHARLGGYLKEWAFHLACVFGSCIVVFSWWHVNFFNTGLHNYGFTAGRETVWAWYILEAVYILLGAIAWWIWTVIENDRKALPPPPTAPAAPTALSRNAAG